MDLLGISSLAIGLISLAYAFKANRDKVRFERLVRARLQRLWEDIDDAKRIAKDAYSHLDGIRRFVQEMPSSSTRSSILDEMTWLHGDVTSIDRLLKRVRIDIESVRDSLEDVANVRKLRGRESIKPSPPE